MDTILINVPVSRMMLGKAELIDGFEWKEKAERGWTMQAQRKEV